MTQGGDPDMSKNTSTISNNGQVSKTGVFGGAPISKSGHIGERFQNYQKQQILRQGGDGQETEQKRSPGQDGNRQQAPLNSFWAQ